MRAVCSKFQIFLNIEVLVKHIFNFRVCYTCNRVLNLMQWQILKNSFKISKN